MKYKVLCLFLILCSAYSCQKKSVLPEILEAENCKERDMPRADSILDRIENPELLDDENQARYALCKVHSLLNSDCNYVSDSLIKIAAKFYEENPDSFYLAECLRFKASVLDRKQRYREYVDCLEQALNIYPDSCKLQKSKFYAYLAYTLCFNFGIMDPAKQYFDKSIELGLSLNDSIYLPANYGFYSSFWFLKNNLDSAVYCSKRQLSFSDSNRPAAEANDAYSELARIESDRGNIDSAFYYWNKSMEADRILNEGIQNPDSAKYYLVKAHILIKAGRRAEAKEALEVYGASKDSFNLPLYYNLYYRLYYADSNYKDALKYYKKLSAARYSEQKEDDKKLIVETERRYEMERQLRESELVRSEREKRWIYSGISLLVIMLLILVVYVIVIRGHRQRSELELSLLRQNRRLSQMQQKLDTGYQQQAVQESTYQRIVDMYSAYLNSYVREIRDVTRKVNQSKNPDNVVSVIASLRSKNEELFTLYVNTEHLPFILSLRRMVAELNDNDMIMCSLYHLGLETDDVSRIMGCSQDALRKRRSRIFQKVQQLYPDISSFEDMLDKAAAQIYAANDGHS